MRKCFYLSFLVLLVFVYGCKRNEQKVYNVLSGSWLIDSWIYNGEDLRSCIAMNDILFYDDNVIAIPATMMCNEYKDSNTQGRFLIIHKNKDDIRLIITTKNKFFKDTVEVNFISDTENRLMRMELRSKNTYVLCTKGFVDYLRFKSEINKIATIKY